MIFYWDTSGILTLVFQEEKTKPFQKFVRENKALPGYTSYLSFIETESVIQRRLREGSLKVASLSQCRLQLKKIESSLAKLWPSEVQLESSKRNVADLGLKPGDAIQLASAQFLTTDFEVAFLGFDDKLMKAAQAVGIKAPTI